MLYAADEVAAIPVHSQDSFTRLASFVCDSDEDEPFSDQDLQLIEAIEAQFQSSASVPSLPNKRPFNLTRGDGAATPDESPLQSKRGLPKSMLALQHPNALPFSSCQGYSRMRLPSMKFGGHIIYSRTAKEVEKAVMGLLKTLEAMKKHRAQVALGFDIEWKPTFRKGVPPGKAAVMQLCCDTNLCHVLHIIHSGIPQCLQLLLGDPAILKVGAGIAGDARKVSKDYNISVKGVEDLSFHANQKLGGETRNWSLTSLSEHFVSKHLQKPGKIRLGNWETRSLSQKQLDYAATDAFASWYIYQVIRELPDAHEVGPAGRGEGETDSQN